MKTNGLLFRAAFVAMMGASSLFYTRQANAATAQLGGGGGCAICTNNCQNGGSACMTYCQIQRIQWDCQVNSGCVDIWGGVWNNTVPC